MNRPIVICEDSFQIAWAKAIFALSDHHWNAWNILVQICNPALYDIEINQMLNSFASENGILTPKHVAHTIFPQQFYKNSVSREMFYNRYWRFFEWSRKRPHSSWGTYFERMIRYPTPKGVVDQLGSIIDNIRNRKRNFGAANTMVIPFPFSDRNRPRGAPCLNYVTVQTEHDSQAINGIRVNLLAVYRSHDYYEKTYGNYLGLCNLIGYIAQETDSSIGMLTCISSHATVPKKKEELLELANNILEVKH